MKHRLFLAALFLTALLIVSVTDFSLAGSWGTSSPWKDGRAEVAVYDSERIVYGKVRTFKEQLITVAENLDKDTLVKTSKKKKSRRVLKLNIVQKFDTENYPYSYMTSVFVDAKSPREIVKLTSGSQEWCGNTFKIYKQKTSGFGKLEWHSYFEDEADGITDVVIHDNDYFEDALPVSLRELKFKKGLTRPIRIWKTLTDNRTPDFEIDAATMTVLKEEIVRSRAGSHPSWKIEIKRKAGSDFYWFAKKRPHVLTKMETHDGRKRLLYGKVRWKYWDRRFPAPKPIQ